MAMLRRGFPLGRDFELSHIAARESRSAGVWGLLDGRSRPACSAQCLQASWFAQKRGACRQHGYPT